MGNDPKYICFAKAEGNPFKFLDSIPFKTFSWNSLKEKIRAEFSKVANINHAILVLINCKHCSDESVTSFIYGWGELLLQSCGTTAEQCRDKLKINIFSTSYFMKIYPNKSS